MTTTDTTNWGMTEADDSLHPYPADEPLWTETVWFTWNVPERGILGSIYPVFRPNLGIHFGGIYVCDPTGVVPWEIPVYHWQQHVPLPEPPDLRNLRLPTGLSIRALSPARLFEITYDSDELQLELRYESVMQPLVSGGESDLFHAGGHIDQPGHVTGRMVMHGEEIAVDCLAQRDRAWGPRRDNRQMRVGYCYGTASADSAFLSISGVNRAGEDKVWSGYLMRDGVWSKLASGRRTVERGDHGRVLVTHIEAQDELGRPLSVSGEMVSMYGATPYPSMICWNGLTRWELDGQECWGEDQDCWSPRQWRRHVSSSR